MALGRLLVASLVAVAALPGQEPAQAPANAAGKQFNDVPALMASLPAAHVKPLDDKSALVFTALPLACLDDLQPRPGGAGRAYFWQPTYRTIDGYDKTRAFYGCNDWATSVSATWTLVSLLKQFPDVGSGQLIREKLGLHLAHDNLDGELAYYKNAGNAQRPYGYAWFLRLYADLATWKDPDGTRYADNAAPLARYFAEGIVSYLVDLERPNRGANQTNSALSLMLLLDYVDVTRDNTIKRAAGDTAKRLYLTDTDCATNTEAAAPEMVSPCLEEAAVMSRVLDAAAFGAWFDKFMPSVQSSKFAPLRAIDFDATGGRGRGGGRGANANAGAGGAASANGRSDANGAAGANGASGANGAASTSGAKTGTAKGNASPTKAKPGAANGANTSAASGVANNAGAPATAGATGNAGAETPATGAARGPQINPRANWIALAFTRAQAYAALAAALPASDPRTAAFKRLSDIHAESGQKEVSSSAAYDAPWIGAFAVSYLSSIGGHK